MVEFDTSDLEKQLYTDLLFLVNRVDRYAVNPPFSLRFALKKARFILRFYEEEKL